MLEREIHVAGGRFMFEGGEVHVGGGERVMFEGGEVHVGGGGQECRNAHLKLTLVTGIIKGFINASNNQFVNRILRWYALPALTVKSV